MGREIIVDVLTEVSFTCKHRSDKEYAVILKAVLRLTDDRPTEWWEKASNKPISWVISHALEAAGGVSAEASLTGSTLHGANLNDWRPDNGRY